MDDETMTLPDEEQRSLNYTRAFLAKLLYPAKTPRIPKQMRIDAYWLLRHYPSAYRVEELFKGEPK